MRLTEDLAGQMTCWNARGHRLTVTGVIVWFLVGGMLLVSPYTAAGSSAAARELWVCADPNNLPFSNERKEGFENKIAELIACQLGAVVRYT